MSASRLDSFALLCPGLWQFTLLVLSSKRQKIDGVSNCIENPKVEGGKGETVNKGSKLYCVIYEKPLILAFFSAKPLFQILAHMYVRCLMSENCRQYLFYIIEK